MSGIVKALEWSTPFAPGENGIMYDHVIAESPIGRYLIAWKGWKDYPTYTVDDAPGDFFVSADRLEDAKAAAQSDYGSRILSALVDPEAIASARENAEKVERMREALAIVVNAHDTGRYESAQAAYEHAKNILEEDNG